jgi:DNA-binding response OmpR family regulator
MRILLVEDDSRIANFVAKGLREQAYAVDVAVNGEDALYQASINAYDLAILDVMIPAPDGFEVCRRLRQSGLRFPILMLTARDATDDRVRGLDTGADDYLIKPFDFASCWRGCAHSCGVRPNCGPIGSPSRTLCWTLRPRRRRAEAGKFG